MITLSKFKSLIDQEANGLTDEEVEKMRQDLYVLAGVAFDFWVKEKAVKRGKIDEKMV